MHRAKQSCDEGIRDFDVGCRQRRLEGAGALVLFRQSDEKLGQVLVLESEVAVCEVHDTRHHIQRLQLE